MAASLGIDGLVSGLSTSDIIAQLMAVESRSLISLQTKQATTEERANARRDINTRLSALQSTLTQLTLRSIINAKSVTTDISITSAPALAASANADAANGSFKVTISQLATATTLASSSALGQAIDADAPLDSAGFGPTPTDGQFTINGTEISVTTSADSLNDIIARINANVAGVTAELADAEGNPDANGNYLKLSSASSIQLGSGADTSNLLAAVGLLDAIPAPATVSGGIVNAGALASTSIHIDGVIVTTRATATGNSSYQNALSLAEDINNTPGIQVTASATTDGKLVLTSKGTGVGSSIEITEAGMGTGLSVGTTSQDSDLYLSTHGLGVVQTASPLSSARLATPLSGLSNGEGQFKINGVSIDFSEDESLNAVISRINASGAGVSVSYDSAQDVLNLVANDTGGAAITFEDVTGNFLEAVGLLGARQSYGQNAIFTIDTVNGGQPLSSDSNVVTDLVPGVTLTLKAPTSSPVTITISQNTASAVAAVRAFVDQYNSTMELIRAKTSYDPILKKSAILSGDSAVKAIESSLRTMLTTPAVGASGNITTLLDVGISTGAIGSAVGTTNSLLLDESKLTEALQDDPNAVAALFAGFSSTATLEGGGSGSIASISGTPSGHHEAGSYLITSTASGYLTAVFTPNNGTAQTEVTGTITDGGTNTTLIPGITLTATSPLTDGTNTITVTVQQRGVAVVINDYLKELISATGLFAQRADASDAEIQALSQRIYEAEERLAEKEQRLIQKFAALEVTLSKLQAQSSYLSAQLLQMSTQGAWQ